MDMRKLIFKIQIFVLIGAIMLAGIGIMCTVEYLLNLLTK